MKRGVYFIICAVALLSLWSCSDDDDGIMPDATMTIYGRPYHLASGVIWESNPYEIKSTVPYVFHDTYMKDGVSVEDEVVGFTQGDDRAVYGNFMLSLYEPGLSYSEGLNQVAGKGACVCFHLASVEQDRLVPGKYVLSAKKGPNTFEGYLSSSYNTEETVTPAKLTEGEVKVEQSGEGYEVTFNCKTGSGGEVAGSYAGLLKACRVRQQVLASYENITLAGLLDSVATIESDNVTISYGLDINIGAAYFSTKTGTSIHTGDAGKGNVDIALVWDRTKEVFYFESPIRMRALTGHQDIYNFPCHTLYMKAPVTFTDADYEKLEETGFQFEVSDEKVEVETQLALQPEYIFFSTGNGTKGVIRVKRFNPLSWEESWLWGILYLGKSEVNPSLVVDVKCSSDFLNPQLR